MLSIPPLWKRKKSSHREQITLYAPDKNLKSASQEKQNNIFVPLMFIQIVCSTKNEEQFKIDIDIVVRKRKLVIAYKLNFN